jgi:hypothetical protein
MQLKNWKGRKMNQSILPSYFVSFPEFKSTLMKWMITTYQPLLVMEGKESRNIYLVLNKRCPLIGHD